MRQARQIAGRHLGWSAEDLASRPYARFWNPELAPMPARASTALIRGAVPEPFLPPLSEAAENLFGNAPVLEDGFVIARNGEMRVSVLTDMPGVVPEMIDWWFGWHGDEAAKYKLWHPRAHVHAQWLRDPPKSSRGRARYVGQTSIVDEYIGSDMIRGAIRFAKPAELGLADPSLDDPKRATIVCARTGLADAPIEVGYLAHHVRAVAGGSEMRSRFWLGGPHIAGRKSRALSSVAAWMGKRTVRLTERDARALLVHCAEEMQHLAGFLPALHAEFADKA